MHQPSRRSFLAATGTLANPMRVVGVVVGSLIVIPGVYFLLKLGAEKLQGILSVLFVVLALMRVWGGEVGIVQALASGAVQIDGTAFVNRYTDMIISVGRTFSGVSRWRTDNISNARARGAEVSAAWRVHQVSLRGSYTFLDSEILAVNGSTVAQAPYAVGDPLLRRPRHSGTVDATMTQGLFSGFVQLQLRGETLDAEPAFGPTGGLYTNPGYAVFNLGGSWRIVRKVEIFARAMNLFDRHYEEVFGYPAPGRTGYVGARVAVGR